MSKELFISSSPHETKVAVLEDDELVEVYHERDTGWALVGSIYKGRVTRVLPGMQSAFVDIGLERDAFLYVSDFFEDSEEYERVVSEAEARVGRVTAAETAAPAMAEVSRGGVEPATGEAGGTSTTSSAPEASVVRPEPESAEIHPSSAEEGVSGERVAPPRGSESPGAPSGTSPAAELPPVQHSPAPLPPRANEPFEYRDRDRRGRRRRRGRGGFGDHRFSPKPEPRPATQPPPSYGVSQEFEILPGESLAKYSRTGSEATHAGTDVEETVSPREAAVPGSTTEDKQQEDSTAITPEGTESSVSPADRLQQERSGDQTAPSDEYPAALAGSAAGRDALEETIASETPVDTAASDRGPTTGEIPASVSFAGEVELRPSEPAEAAASEVSERQFELQPLPAPETRPTEETERLEPGPTEPTGFLASSPSESSSEITSDAEPVVVSDAETGSGASTEQETPSEEGAPVDVPSVEVPMAPPTNDRSYTLREPQQRRPRFAPRRGRRGRRGMGPEGPRPRPSSEIPRSSGNNQPVQISELLKEGQEILVQIAKEPLGNKGARITSHVALPGRYLVYMPTIHHIGVSRKIASEEERLRLRNIILENRGSLTGGFIVRTAGQGRSLEEFKADLRFLTTLWNEVRAKFERGRAPALLHRDLDLTQRILRDILSPDFKRIRVDNEVEYERIVDFVSRCQPALLGNIKLYQGDAPLYEEFGVQAEIDKALKPKVWLKSGGFIVINQTEALVAVDVNTGKYVGKTNRLEDTIVKTNIDAVREIVRQIRLRDLGGIIVIDFIDMDERRNRQKVVQALEEALRRDRAPTNILSINEFGLVALTRKRVKQSLERTLCEPCPYCTGSGWIKSVTTVCYEILSEARKMANEIAGKVINLRVNPEVARALKSREGILLSELESMTRKDVVVKSDPTVQQERFEIY